MCVQNSSLIEPKGRRNRESLEWFDSCLARCFIAFSLQPIYLSSYKNYIVAQKLVARLREKGWYIATAESITAGYVAGFIASVAQASQCFRGGIVTYDSWSKVQLLGLPEELIRDTDGVSAKVSKLMAEAARVKFSAHIGVSTTGFAGPTGREIGLIYVGISTVKETRVNQKKIRAQREDVRLQTSLDAFILALNTLDSMSNDI